MKKSKKYFALIMSCAIIITSIIATFPVQAATTDNMISISELENSAGAYLEDKASVMLSNNYSTNNVQTGFKTRTSNREKALIKAYRDRLAQKGETYSDYDTNLEILSQTVGDDGNLYVTAKETTMLTIAENNVETGYSANHTFVYEPSSNGWELIEDRQLEPTGLLPLYQANQFVYDYETTEPEVEVSANADDNVAEPEIEADTNKPAVMEENKISTQSGGYNYSAMASYLEKYWSNYNTAYRDFSGKGGDCTNFVSQALRAGGWEDKTGWYKNSNYWWYNSANQTYSWINVDYLGSFARSSGRCSMLDNVWKLRVGDFLQVKAANSTSKTHSMMVSYFSNGTPYFTYHTSNRYRRSMNQVLEDWSGGTYYAYRT